jgi:hypothetical protein
VDWKVYDGYISARGKECEITIEQVERIKKI